MRHNYLLLILLFVLQIACTNNTTATEEEEKKFAIEGQTENGFEDGSYCAEVSYYNAKTGTTNKYTLKVDVDYNKVEKIYFGNGGWLDSDHMTPKELDSDGECKLFSDAGAQYWVKITGRSCSHYDDFTAEDINSGITMEQCAYKINMTEQEITDYESRFNKKRTDPYTEEMCELLKNYMQKRRQLLSESEAFEREVDEGYIQGVYRKGEGDYYYCHHAIVKKYGQFYLLEGISSQACTMGLMQFDHTTSQWQEVLVKENPQYMDLKVFKMRVISYGATKEELLSQIEMICGK
ncbi:hypothetical protein [Lacibacter sp. H407]|uniref:hypothetical protein n=1 Tax=Lacibacter sp. H407 TaxID=3133423 RepID=UPI0030C3ADDB